MYCRAVPLVPCCLLSFIQERSLGFLKNSKSATRFVTFVFSTSSVSTLCVLTWWGLFNFMGLFWSGWSFLWSSIPECVSSKHLFISIVILSWMKGNFSNWYICMTSQPGFIKNLVFFKCCSEGIEENFRLSSVFHSF